MRSEPAGRAHLSSPPAPSQALARLAADQHGLLRREQLLEHGVSASAIGRRLAAEQLHRVRHNVYALGHPLLPPLGAEHAAVLAVSTWDPDTRTLGGAALSHQSAAVHQGLLRRWDGPLHVTSLRRNVLDGGVVHTVRALDPRHLTTLDRVPVTAWFRTLLDLAEALEHRWLVRALEQAVLHELYHHRTLVAAMDRSPGRHGIAALRAALATGHHLRPQMTRSLLEDEFLFLVREADPPLPFAPDMNADVVLSRGERYEIDALFRRPRVAVELDSRLHDVTGAEIRDETRDRALRRDGHVVLRFRWADVVQRPGWVLWRLRDAFARRG